VQAKGASGWRTVGKTRVRADGTFKLTVKLRRKGRHKGRLLLRVLVPGIGASKPVVLVFGRH
jgi:hypothetical protein